MIAPLFISHGAPTLGMTDTPARDFLRDLGQTLPRPQAIVVASAHWETRAPRVSAQNPNETIHDFRGFPRALHEMRYPAPGAPALSQRIAKLLSDAGLPADIDPARGLDHGAWVPLALMYPNADVPVLQVAIQSQHGPDYHFALGAALAPLAVDDVLVIGSGSFTHDLGRFHGQAIDTPATPDVTAFAEWFDGALREGRHEDLMDYRRRAPYAVENHPTEEHLLPLYVAWGAGGDQARAKHLHASSTYGILRMDAYSFAPAA